MDATAFLPILLILALVALAIARQVSARRADARTLVAIPLVLAGLGVAQALGQPLPSSAAIAELGASIAIAAALGVWRGSSVRVWRDDRGALMMKGTRTTLALWLATILIRVALGVGLAALGFATAGTYGIAFVAAATIGAQNAAVWYRRPVEGAAASPGPA